MYDSEGLGQDGFWTLERELNDLQWNIQSSQILHQIPSTLEMSTKSLTLYSSNLGEDICICLKPWIITSRTMKEKTVPTLQGCIGVFFPEK